MARQGWMRTAVMAARVAVVWGVGAVFSGCAFGVEEEKANPIIENWYNKNCVPSECVYECCQGWYGTVNPDLSGGEWVHTECNELRTTNSVYAEYAALMELDVNYCTNDYKYLESGTCNLVRPEDALRKIKGGGTEYSGLTFIICPPRGQKAASPIEGVALVPQE